MPWEEMYQRAAAAPEFAAVIDPDDAGFYNPQNMEEALVSYCRQTGQTPPEGRGGLLRMVYESLALKYRAIQEDLAAVCGSAAKIVHIVGGGARNKMLNQFVANALRLPVEAGPYDATAIGNLMVQAVGVGAVESLAAIVPAVRRAFPVELFRPQPETSSRWIRAYARFKTLRLRADLLPLGACLLASCSFALATKRQEQGTGLATKKYEGCAWLLGPPLNAFAVELCRNDCMIGWTFGAAGLKVNFAAGGLLCQCR